MKGLAPLALLLLAAAGGCREAPAENLFAPAEPARIAVTIESGGRTHVFGSEIARTEEEQRVGLMSRTELAPDAGMIFPFAAPRIASFWMEDTAIPLDMIFIRSDGTIARIAENVTPFSRVPVSSVEPVVAVFEIAGGRSAELGLRAGDQVRWPGGPA